MGKIIKVTVVTAGIILILIITASLTAGLWFPAEKIRNLLAEQAARSIGRDVSIGALRLNIFKGIELENVAIKEVLGGRDFIKADKVVLKYSLIGLLRKELIIRQLEFINPYGVIIRQKDGTLNYTDILVKMGSKKEAVTQAKNTYFNDIIITGVVLKKGTFIYMDYSREKPLSVKIENASFSTGDLILSVIKPVRVEAGCDVVYGEFRIPVSLRSTLKIDLAGKKVDAEITKLDIAGITTTGSVSVKDFRDVSGSAYTVTGINDILKIMPSKYLESLKGIRMDLVISNKADFSFINNKAQYRDVAEFSRGAVTYQENKIIDGLNGRAEFKDDFTLNGELNFMLSGSKVRTTISADRMNDIKNAEIRCGINSSKLALEYLFALMPKKSADTGLANGGKTAVKERTTKKHLPDAPGTYINISADSVTFKDVTAGRTVSNIRIIGGKINMDTTIAAYEGNISSKAYADINNENYTFELSTTGVKVNRFISDAASVLPKNDTSKNDIFDELKGKVYGSCDMNVSFSGGTFTDAPHTMLGKGTFIIKNGKIGAMEIGRSIAAKTGIKELGNDITFDIAAGEFTMSNGRVNLKNFRVLTGPDGNSGIVKIRSDGYVTVDNVLDIKTETDLSPVISKQVEQTISSNLGISNIGFAYDNNGWLPFDFRVYGTFAEKKYDYNQKRLMNNISVNLSKKFKEEGPKYFEDEGKKILNKIFGN